MPISFKKITRLFLAAIVILALIEFALRAAASFYCMWYAVIAKPKADLKDSVFNIICVGESTTYGLPVHGSGYPEQLEKLLNNNSHDSRRFRVFNLGVCAITSSEIARHFYKNIIDYKPKLVIILAGNNKSSHSLLKFLYNGDKNMAYYIADKMHGLKTVRVLYFVYTVLEGYLNKTISVQRLHSDTYIEYNNKGNGHAVEMIERYNMKHMIDIAIENKCKILICNYFDSQANNFLRYFAIANNIPFCDNEASFEKWPGNRPELISDDGWHPSLKGYSLMAQNIYDAIIKYKLIPDL